MKLRKRIFYVSSNSSKNFLSRSYTTKYIQERGRTFVHTVNSLVIHKHHQNIQMRSQNLMLNQILDSIGVNVPPQIPYVPDIASLTEISTTSTSDIAYPPTYEHLHRNLLP